MDRRLITLAAEPTVYVIDADAATRAALGELAGGMNLACQSYASGSEFFAAYTDSAPGCLVLEVRLPDTSGIVVQNRLAAKGATLPLVFLTSQDDVSLAVQLMRNGAFHYVQEPLRAVDQMRIIPAAIALNERHRQVQQRRDKILERLAVLTPKEREVLDLIAQELTTGTAADWLKLSRRTIEIYRSAITRKLKIHSSFGLLYFARLAYFSGATSVEGTRYHSVGRDPWLSPRGPFDVPNSP